MNPFPPLLGLFFALGSQDAVVLSSRESPAADRNQTNFEFVCDRRTLSLLSVNSHGHRAEEAHLLINRRRVDLPPEMRSYLDGEQATYRVSAVCAPARSFGLIVYRATRDLDGNVAYSSWAFDVTHDGRVNDRGLEAIGVSDFYFR